MFAGGTDPLISFQPNKDSLSLQSRMAPCSAYPLQATDATENVPSKHDTLKQCRVNVGPPSATLAQH